MTDKPSAPPAVQADPPARCADCGTALNAGEAKCFTVCDACWAKVYPRVAPPAEPPTDLRTLIEKLIVAWREKYRTSTARQYYNRVNIDVAYDDCADELEEALRAGRPANVTGD